VEKFIPMEYTCTFFPIQIVFMGFIWISEQTAITSLNNTNQVIFLMETRGVFLLCQNWILKYYLDDLRLQRNNRLLNIRFCSYSSSICFLLSWLVKSLAGTANPPPPTIQLREWNNSISNTPTSPPLISPSTILLHLSQFRVWLVFMSTTVPYFCDRVP
jgi:hypothetical protein